MGSTLKVTVRAPVRGRSGSFGCSVKAPRLVTAASRTETMGGEIDGIDLTSPSCASSEGRPKRGLSGLVSGPAGAQTGVEVPWTGLAAELQVDFLEQVDDIYRSGTGGQDACGAVGELDQRRAYGGEFVCGDIQLEPRCAGGRDDLVVQP